MNSKHIGVSIGSVLDSDHSNAQLWRSILNYPIKISCTADCKFDVTTIGKWLLDNHPPFRNEFEGSKIPMNYRLQSKRTTIKDRLHELSKLNLIQLVNRIKSDRNDTVKDIYAFTETGHYIGWLIEAQDQQNQKEKIAAYKKVIQILEVYFGTDHSALSIAFTSFLRKCKNNLEGDNFLIIALIRSIFPYPTYEIQNKSNILWSVSEFRDIANIFIDSIEELDEETRRLVFFQIKLDVESSICTCLKGVNRQWENTRYNNISDYNKLTTLQECEVCKNAIPFKVDIIDFLRSSLDVTIKGGSAISNNKFCCDKCGKENTAKHFLQYYLYWWASADMDIKKIGNER